MQLDGYRQIKYIGLDRLSENDINGKDRNRERERERG